MKIMGKKFIKPVIIGLVCVIAAGAFYYYFSTKKSKAKNSVSNVVVMKVQKGSIVKKATGTGNISSGLRKEIKTLANGIVDQIFVQEGQSVQEGDKILTFQNDQANSQLESAQLSLQMQENKLAQLNRDLKELRVYATASGVVGTINADEGDDVSEGSSLLSITDKKSLEVTGVFNAAQIKHIHLDDKAVVQLVDSFATVNGKVTDIGSSPVDSSDGTVGYEVTVTFSNPGGLSQGMTAQVTVKNDQGSYQAADATTIENKSPKKVNLETSGTLEKLSVSKGDTVKKGQLLATLKSQSLLDNIKDQKLQIQQSQFNLDEIQQTINDSVVYAPISGTITEVDVTKGERVSENSTVAVVSDLNSLEVIIPVDELDINDIHMNMSATISVSSVADKEFKAVVTEIAKEGTISNGVSTFDVKLSLKNIEGLKPGMSATGSIIIAQKDQALLVPVEAIQERRSEKFVLVRKNGQDESVPIEIGIITDEMAEITKGLTEGDQVVYTMTSSSNTNSRPSGGGMMMGAPSGGAPSSGGNRRSGN